MYPIKTLRRRVSVAEYQALRYARAVKRELEAIRQPAPGDAYSPHDHLWLYRRHMRRLHQINQFLKNAKHQLAEARNQVDLVRKAQAHDERAAAAIVRQLAMIRTWGVPYVYIPRSEQPETAQEVTK
jgi:hypothetical protein